MRRSTARLAAASRSRTRDRSSPKPVSSTQCRRFSMPQCARTAAAMRASGAAELVREQRISRLTPRRVPGAGFSTRRRVSTATTRRRPGQAAVSSVAPGNSAASATNTHRRDGPAMALIHRVGARAQPAAEREGARGEPVPRRRVQGAAVALERDRVVGAAHDDRPGRARVAGGGVQADQRASDVEPGQQVGQRRGLAAAIGHAPLRQHEAAPRREGADPMQRRPPAPAVERASQRLGPPRRSAAPRRRPAGPRRP